MEKLKGVLKRIIFSNPESGFLIGQFRDCREEGRLYEGFTALGNLLHPEPGMKYCLRGSWKIDKKYGKQFQFKFYEVVKPKSVPAIFKYLVRIGKHVGPKIGAALTNKYGVDTLDILKLDPERVAREISGLSLEKATELAKTLIDAETVESVLIELEEMLSEIPGVKKSLPVDLINLYGSNAAIKVREDPYLLTGVHGVGFPSADKIALSIGLPQNSKKRIRACVRFVLQAALQQSGSTWIHIDEVKRQTINLIGLNPEAIIGEMVENKTLSRREGFLTTFDCHRHENTIASAVAAFLSHRPEKKGGENCYPW